MDFTKICRVVFFSLVIGSYAATARATPINFTFTGSGANGSTAAGTFSVDSVAITPGYFAQGAIYPSLSLTISNIPGAGPSSVSFNLTEIDGAWFNVDAGGAAYIG